MIIIGGAIWSGDENNDQMRMGLTIDESLAQERLAGFASRDWFAGLKATQNGEIYGVDHGSLRNILDYNFTVYIAKFFIRRPSPMWILRPIMQRRWPNTCPR